MAVDRDLYVQAITDGKKIPARGLLPPGMPGYSEEWEAPKFDPDQARRILEQSRYFQNNILAPEIHWVLPSRMGKYSPDAEFLVDSWESNLGINIFVEGVSPEVYNQRTRTKRLGQIYFDSWCADYPDPENFFDALFRSGSAQNRSGYANPVLDGLLEQARNTGKWDIRGALYVKAEQILAEDAPAIFLVYSGPTYVVWKPQVKGYQPSRIAVPQHHRLWIEW
jgi:oligopeptide transport system substrate-binding protein